MSGPELTGPTRSYELSLGLRADRHINARGGGDVARRGAQRAIHFDGCELRGIDVETKTSTAIAFIYERSPNQLPWPDMPWKIGEIDLGHPNNLVSLHIPPPAFQYLWELAEAPRKERFVVSISSQIAPDGAVRVYEAGFQVRPRTHPVARELRPMLASIQSRLVWLEALVTAILVVELIRWLWR